MKVLHLVKTVRGATWALRQVEALRRLGVEIVVALPSAKSGLAPAYARAGATVVEADLDFTPTPALAARLARCRTLVARVRPDVIHSHFVGTTLVARLALGKQHRVPRVFQVPGPLHLEHAATRALELATAGPRDHWIASCRWTREAYRAAGVPRARVFLSYYGTELPAPAARGAFRRELGLGADVPLVGMVAHVYAPRLLLGQRRGLKGHEDFIEGVAALRRGGMPVRAVVVGGPWAGAERYVARLHHLAWRQCRDVIRFTGHRTDVPSVYADLDVAVHPSLSENCGGAVESLAAGCPTVATRVGGLPDVVVHGETGWLVPPRAPERLAKAIREALLDRTEAQRRTAAGQALVRELFAVERTAAEVADIYRAILSGVTIATAPAEERIAV
jgi:glycosyltransferase involved in cell wall biosynthesis